MPQLEDFVQLSDDDVSSGDEEDVEVIEVSDPFDQAECKEIRMSKKLRRGLQYVKSGYVGHVDTSMEKALSWKCPSKRHSVSPARPKVG